MHLIAGLGNPGRGYKYTRHNVGFTVIDALAKKLGVKFRRRKDYFWSETTTYGKPVIIAKPKKFVNLSGLAVKKMAVDFGIENKNILIIHDDADLSLGTIRLKKNGGSGGHNGIESVIKELGTNDFSRLKVGIGRDNGDLKDYVLSIPSSSERKVLDKAVETSLEAISVFVDNGMDEAMLLFNKQD
jgi:PTH1 family peptidyl-tRNA hydrolase